MAALLACAAALKENCALEEQKYLLKKGKGNNKIGTLMERSLKSLQTHYKLITNTTFSLHSSQHVSSFTETT